MGKKKETGWVNHGFNWDCWNCCCCVCTGRYCPYRNHDKTIYRFRCDAVCRADNKIVKALDCDFFQNRHTSRKVYKIRRRWHRKSLSEKLDLIMQKLDIDGRER